MAYTITVYNAEYDETTVLLDTRLTRGFDVLKAALALEANSAQALAITLDINSDGLIEPLTTTVVVRRVGVSEPLFVGRAITRTENLDGTVDYTFEGDLSYLLDTVRKPYAFTGTPTAFLSSFLTEHNAQVETGKRFAVGTVTVTPDAGTGNITRSNDDYTRTYDELLTKTVQSTQGGLLATSGQPGARVLDWRALDDTVSSQVLRFGENMLSYRGSVDGSETITKLMPLGAVIEGSNPPRRVDITSVNGGSPYITVADVEKFGTVIATKVYEDAPTPANLLGAVDADGFGPGSSGMPPTLDLSAVDLSLIDADVESFSVGDTVRVVIPDPYGVDEVLAVTAMSVDLLAPENTKITVGGTHTTLTDSTGGVPSSGGLLVSGNGSNGSGAVFTGARIPFTPTYVGFALGNGTVVAGYQIIGKRVFIDVSITLGSTSAFTATTSPVTPFAINNPSNIPAFIGIEHDSGQGTAYQHIITGNGRGLAALMCRTGPSVTYVEWLSSAPIYADSGTGGYSQDPAIIPSVLYHDQPWAWAAGDRIVVAYSYPIA